MILLFHIWIKINDQKWQQIIWGKKRKWCSCRFEFFTVNSRPVNRECPQTQSLMILERILEKRKVVFSFPLKITLLKEYFMILWSSFFTRDYKTIYFLCYSLLLMNQTILAQNQIIIIILKHNSHTHITIHS